MTTEIFDMFKIITLQEEKFSQSDPVLSGKNWLQSWSVLTSAAHILEPYWTKSNVCPDSCSFEDNLYCFASLLPMIISLKGIVA